MTNKEINEQCYIQKNNGEREKRINVKLVNNEKTI